MRIYFNKVLIIFIIYHLSIAISEIFGSHGYCLCFIGKVTKSFAQDSDWRNIENGLIIPDKTYSDQPYIVKTDDGAWLCVPKIITFVVDGILNDGGDSRQFGWGRFSPFFQSAVGSSELKLGTNVDGKLRMVRFFDRALKTTEVIANQFSMGKEK